MVGIGIMKAPEAVIFSEYRAALLERLQLDFMRLSIRI